MTEKYKAKRLKKIQVKNRKRKHEHNKYIEGIKLEKIESVLPNDFKKDL